MTDTSMELSVNNGLMNGANGHIDAGRSGDKPHKSHKSHKQKKHKEHKEHKHKKEKKHKKDKHKEKHLKSKQKYEDLQAKAEPSSSGDPQSPSISTSNLDLKLQSSSVKQEVDSDDQDNVPLTSRKRPANNDDADSDYEPLAGKTAKKPKVEPKAPSRRKSTTTKATAAKGKLKAAVKADPGSPTKKKTKRELAKEQEQKEVWKWWEEDRKDDGVKWKFLEHLGPVLAPPYEPLPSHVKLVYDGKAITLSEPAEEVAGFYAKMLNHDYCTMEQFNKNFFKDWRKVMTSKEQELIKDLKKCNFKPMNEYFTEKSEERKNRSKEEKQKEKADNEALIEKYGFCTIDGHREKIGNFRIEPPGLFRGRGEHPKMGMLKKRVMSEEVTINCSSDSKFPEPPKGHKWKEVRHDDTVTWLATWTENVQGQNKYVMLNPASRLKGEKDWQKYEKARSLHKIIDRVRANYQNDWKSKEMRLRQRAVALYFIDKLALRAGNEKDSDEQADTVGCCSLRFEHIKLHDEQDDKECVVEFDFLGKDSIRYQNSVAVEKRVYKNLKLFMENKNEGDDLFDRLNTTILNKHLQEIMEGLTAKVFRTYNASRTLEEQLNLLTKENDNVAAKMLAYNRANRAVAVLCNHQRAVPKNFSQQMERIQEKIQSKKKDLKEANKALKEAKQQAKSSKASTVLLNLEKKKKAVERMNEQLHKLEVQATDKDENKDIALGTSKLNYLDPRISVAWCKKYDIPIEKVYNKTQRQKFMWAIDMAGPEFQFIE